MYLDLKNNTEDSNTESNANTSFSKIFEIDSPGFLPCTQEGFENIDVTWDWNSPQSKRIPKKSQKRLALPEYPKKSLKRHLSNNSIQGFEKLQQELRLLREEIAIPEHEESLILSPVEEADYKCTTTSEHCNPDPNHNVEFENFFDETEDFFNDDLDDQLLMCTTQIEDKLKENKVENNSKNSLSKNNYSRNNVGNLQSKPNNISVIKEPNIAQNDASNFNESLLICHSNTNFQINKNNSNNNIVAVGRKEFHRTESFELSNLEHFGGMFHNLVILWKINCLFLKVCQVPK